MEQWCPCAEEPESGIIDIVRDKTAIASPRRAADRVTGARPAEPHAVGIVIYDGITPFDLGIASEVFASAGATTDGVARYRLFVCGATKGPVTAEGGIQIAAPFGLEQIGNVGTLIVPPTEYVDQIPEEVLEALREAHARGCRMLSFCTGAFVLARAGLLDGRRATTHWTECAELARRFPLVSVDPGVLYVDDGDVLTSAGSAAALDLCLHVVRQDYGSEIATQFARYLVVAPQREGGQAQYIEAPIPEFDDSSLFAETLTWLQEHLNEPVSVDDLAERAAMSPRTFARQFLASMGTTPYQWLLRQRVQLARRLLEESDQPIERVAENSGFCTAGNLRKHFSRIMRTSPQAYRRAFQDPSAASTSPRLTNAGAR
jgi:AraC family transcriptional activator FtrA